MQSVSQIFEVTFEGGRLNRELTEKNVNGYYTPFLKQPVDFVKALSPVHGTHCKKNI